jgi:acyl carrier protein
MAGTVEAALTRLFRDIFEDESLILTHDMTAEDIDGWDSTRMIELIVVVEQFFKVKFTTREIDSLHSVGDLIQLIQAKIPP